ncbi:hypothetical protein GCM10023222_35100 [Saccharopolyspora cebuensis]
MILARNDELELDLSLRLRYEIPRVDYVAGERLLEIVDAILYWHFPVALDEHSRSAIKHLDRILTAGDSAWRVSSKLNSLERRVNETATAAAAHVSGTTGAEPAEHLANAWYSAYGRIPDPDKAYDSAVLALESVFCPLVSPHNNRATLGTVIRDLRNQVSKWELAIGGPDGEPVGIAPLVQMLDLIWKGQSRHGGNSNSRNQTQAEAVAAVHMAITLAQWVSSDILTRKD